MASNGDKWVRIFDVPEVSRHKKGFTIYKIISMLYPESCPDAITKITVWKRFNDIKKLHREIKVLHRKNNLKDKYPKLAQSTFFKRFSEETIKERQKSILNFLDYVGSHSNVFTSNEFVKFFETSHTPVEHLSSNICSIRADLNLPEEPEYLSNFSDDDRTISDTDSVSTLSSLSPSVHTTESAAQSISSVPKLRKLSSNTSALSKNSDSLSESIATDSLTLLDGEAYPTPSDTPGTNVIDEHTQYIIDASVHVNLATELERNKKFDEAYTAYKTVVSILERYVKDDTNYERKQMVRYKVEKYSLKAEKIYNMHLAPEVQNIREIVEEPEKSIIRRPISDLYKYKVVRVISNGMLVLHEELQQLFYVKVLHKTMKFLDENLILPENVPYMVKLQNYYNCENALFLILEYCSAVSLPEYLKRHLDNSEEVFAAFNENLMRNVENVDFSDEESEHSYSELISDYKFNRSKNDELSQRSLSHCDRSADNSFEELPDDYAKSVADNIEQEQRTDINYSNEGLTKEKLDTVQEKSSSDAKELEDRSFKNTKRRSSSASVARSKYSSTMSSSLGVDCELISNFIIPLDDVVKWSAQLLLALEKLHVLGVICRDLQLKNLLIDENKDLKLTYMCNLGDLQEVFGSGEAIHLAPELYNFQCVTAAVDWWSYGAILYELLVGIPLSVLHPEGLNSYSSLKIPKYVSPEGRSLLKQLLVYEPTERLGFGLNGVENLKSHPFFSSVSWESLIEKGR